MLRYSYLVSSLILLIVGFIIISGILAMVDAAVLSISRAEVEEMVLQKKSGALALRTINKRITRAVVVIVILTNIVNVLGPILAGQHAIELYGSEIIGWITGGLTLGTIIFSEIIPKSLGAHYAPKIALIAAPVILVLMYVLFPIVVLFEYLASLFKTGRRIIGTEDQIRSLVSIGHKAGHIESDEGQLIQRAFILNDTIAGDIMTPLENVIGVPASATVREAAQTVFKETYSRYPVFGENKDAIKGLVLSQDILTALSEGRDEEKVEALSREVLQVPESMRCDDLLLLFRNRHIHLAVVRSHHKTRGLITLEDVLEELVGEIEDEFDAAHHQAQARKTARKQSSKPSKG